MANYAKTVFRDYNTDGVSGSGALNPVKAEIRKLLASIAESAARFGMSPSNSASANNSGFAALVSSGVQGGIQFEGDRYDLSTTWTWPNGLWPVGHGSQVTKFRFTGGGASDAFKFYDAGLTLERFGHPRGFSLQTTGGTGRAIYAEQCGNNYVFDDIDAQAFGGDLYYFQDCYNLRTVNLSGRLGLARGMVLNGFSHATVHDNPQMTFNVGDNIAIISTLFGCHIHGGDVTMLRTANGGTGHGIHIQAGSNINIGPSTYVENVDRWVGANPDSASNRYAVMIDPSGTQASDIDIDMVWGDALDTQRTVVKVKSTSGGLAENITIRKVTAPGVIGAGDYAVDIDSTANNVVAHLSDGSPARNRSTSSRIVYSHLYESGVAAHHSGNVTLTVDSAFHNVIWDTEDSDPKSEYNNTTGAISNADIGNYVLAFDWAMTHNDAGALTLELEFLYNGGPATVKSLLKIVGYVSGSMYSIYSPLPGDFMQPLGRSFSVRYKIVPGTGTPTVTRLCASETSRMSFFRIR